VRGSLDGLGRVMADLERRQDDLGEAITRHMGTLAPKTLAAMNRDYERLGQTIDAVRKRQEALGAAMARRQALVDERQRLGGEIMGTYATTAAVGVPALSAVREAAGFGDAIKDIAIIGELSREQEQVLGSSLRAIARETNQTARDMAAGVSMLIANGMEANKAAEQARLLGKFTTATRASMDDAARMMVSFDLLGVSAKDMELAFAQAAKAGKLGSFEVRDMAKWFPQLGGYMKAVGITGNEAVVNMASRLQIAMRTAGSTDEAANNFRNFLAKLTSPDTRKDFEKLGIDLQGSMLRAARRGMDPIEAGIGIIMDKMAQRSPKVVAELKALSDEIAKIQDPAQRAAELERRRTMIESLGQRAGLGQMFQDMQAMSYLLAEIQNRDDLKKIQTETATGNGASGKSALEEDYAKRMESPIEQFKRLKIELQDLAMTVGDALLPPLLEIVRAVQPVVSAFAAWAKEHPALIKGLIGAALGMAALKAATLSGAWALNFFVKSPLALASVAWQTLAARVLIGRAALLAGAGPLKAIGMAAGLSTGAMGKLGAAFAWMKGAAVTSLTAVGRAVLWLGRAVLMNPVGLALATSALLIYKSWGPISGFFEGLWSGLSQGFGMIADDIRRAFEPATPLLRPLIDALGWLGDKIKAVMGWLGDIIKPMDDAGGAAKSLGEKVGLYIAAMVKTVLSLPGKLIALPGEMLKIGQQIVAGLIDGIQSKLSAAKDAVMNLGATVRDGLKNLLGIRSPSRVFAELGGFLGEGLSHGMRASLGEVQKAAAAMAGAATIALAPPALAAPGMQATPDAARTIRQAVDPVALPQPTDALRTIRQAVEPVALPQPTDALRTIRQAVEPVALPQPTDALRTIRQAVEPVALPQPTDALRTIRQAVEPVALPQPTDALRTIRQAVEPVALPSIQPAALPTIEPPRGALKAGAAPGAPMHITFAPQITVTGAASPEAVRAQVTQAVQLSFAEFERWMRRHDAERRRVGWEATT
jgi:TP901 family phage tail tape measure protein